MSAIFLGKTLTNEDDINAYTVVAYDIQTNTLEANSIVTDHIETTGPLGLDVHSATNGDLTVTIDPTTGYGTIRTSAEAFGLSLDVQGAGKIVKISTDGSLRVAIQDTRTTIYGDLYVTGNIINIPTNYIFFTPSLVSASGGLGVITYTTQTGVYTLSNGAILYQIEMAGGYAASTSTHLQIDTLPIASASNTYSSVDGISTVTQPLGGIIPSTSTSIDLDDYVTATYIPLTGAASFDIALSGFYISASPSTFTPAFTIDTGTITYTVQIGEYITLNTGVVFFAEIACTYSGATTTSIQLNLPSSVGGLDCVTTTVQPVIGGTGLNGPTALTCNNGTSHGTFNNVALNNNVTISGAGSLHIYVTGTYLHTYTTFHPTIQAQVGTWIDTGYSMTAGYTTSGNILIFTLVYTATVTGTSSDIVLSGLPLTQAVKGVVNNVYTTGLPQPLCLYGATGSNNMTFYSKGLNQNLSVVLVSTPVVMKITGYYIIQ